MDFVLADIVRLRQGRISQHEQIVFPTSPSRTFKSGSCCKYSQVTLFDLNIYKTAGVEIVNLQSLFRLINPDVEFEFYNYDITTTENFPHFMSIITLVNFSFVHA